MGRNVSLWILSSTSLSRIALRSAFSCSFFWAFALSASSFAASAASCSLIAASALWSWSPELPDGPASSVTSSHRAMSEGAAEESD